ncbi:Cytochrome P450 monooxygenase aclL [Lachnellula arida]|uniref:Cytochrome P450 monooxygenase aclL n=1 Tax=Lachnellula arida TaxID=1316785 RepID=A0A8T9B6S7_9HELO|nr:Cytochrome P450 monooxygenase aclL [Lachnellula arida]
MLAPGFSDRVLLEQEPLLTRYFDLLVSELKSKIDGPDPGERRVDVMAYYNFTTFDIIGSDLVLGEPFGALEGGEYHAWIRNVFESIKMLGWIRLGFNYSAIGAVFSILQTLVPSFAQKRKQHMKFTKERLQKRLDSDTDRKDIIAYVHCDNDEKDGLSYEILGNSRILLTAGSETTATHLSGATWYLLTHREILRRVQDEVRTAFRTADEITLRSVGMPGRLPYLDAVIQESFRLYPSVPAALPRITGPEGAVIDGNFVPGKISVGVHQWSTYRSADNFALPNDFIPERWLPNAPQKFHTDNKEALQPFHLGPRVCLGKSLAYFEIRSILTRMLWNFDMQLEDESQHWLDKQKEYTLWDKPSLWVRLDHRRA